jgi:hypothetical protein
VPIVDSGLSSLFALATGKTSGEWVELQIAAAGDRPDRARFDRWRPDSRFLTFDALALFHEAFAKAYASAGGGTFDLFLPRLFDAPLLERLGTELDALERQLLATPDLASAKARWGPASPIVRGLTEDGAWLDVRGALVQTTRGLTAIATEIRGHGGGLWVVGSSDPQ